MRRPPGGGPSTQHLPSPPQVPVFTVRQFMGTILNAVRPFYGVTQMFGIDVYQLRLIFADWPVGITEEYPVQAGDTITFPQGMDNNGNPINHSYQIVGNEQFPGSHIEIYVATTPRGQ